jgi:hypothetical protein
MTEWRSYTPDGHELYVRREGGGPWVVRCGGGEVESESLDVALIEAIRADLSTPLHRLERDYAAWVQTHADAIRSELDHEP